MGYNSYYVALLISSRQLPLRKAKNVRYVWTRWFPRKPRGNLDIFSASFPRLALISYHLSLLCEHTFCSSCISRLPDVNAAQSDDAPIPIRCPQCRETCSSDQIELVQYTASEQWDALLAVAEEWAKMDGMRREQETSEEENSEAFIDDGEGGEESR